MHIVLDSVFLQGRVNPRTPEIETILDRAQNLGWKVYIPEAVLFEIHTGMSEGHKKRASSVKDSISEAQRYGIEIQNPEINISESTEKYKTALEVFFTESGIVKIPFPKETKSLRELFELAAQKSPPFDEKGDSFRDTVIWLSVEAFANQQSGQVFFVTRDRSFIERCSSLLNSARNIRILNYDDLEVEFNNRINAAKKAEIDKLRGKVSAFMDKEGTERLINLINKYPFDIWPTSGELTGIVSFHIKEQSVDSITQKENRLTCSLVVKGELFFTVQPSIAEIMADELLRQTQSVKPKTIAESRERGTFLKPPSTFPIPEPRLVPPNELPPLSPPSGSFGYVNEVKTAEITFSVDLSAKLNTNGDIESIKFEKIELTNSPYFIFRRRMKTT